MRDLAVGILRRVIPGMFPLPLRWRVLLGSIRDHKVAYEIFPRWWFLYKAYEALSVNGITGDYLEFGCHGAGTFSLAYGEIRRRGRTDHLWAFDSFAGLPETTHARDEHPRWVPGTWAMTLDEFHRQCSQNGLDPQRYTAVEGFYSDSLEALDDSAVPTDVALAYIDCDLYTSTDDVLRFLQPRLKHGMILAFDDYFCWSGSQVAGERLAAHEHFPADGRWNLVPYTGFGWHGMSFFLEDRELIP